MKDIMLMNKYSEMMESSKWRKEITPFKLLKDLQIKVVPPDIMAVTRFLISYKKKYVSVYLDCYEHLGTFGGPYYEAYPINGDTYRVAMKDVQKLINKIEIELRKGGGLE